MHLPLSAEVTSQEASTCPRRRPLASPSASLGTSAGHQTATSTSYGRHDVREMVCSGNCKWREGPETNSLRTRILESASWSRAGTSRQAGLPSLRALSTPQLENLERASSTPVHRCFVFYHLVVFFILNFLRIAYNLSRIQGFLTLFILNRLKKHCERKPTGPCDISIKIKRTHTV